MLHQSILFQKVSIHAPVMERHSVLWLATAKYIVSIHAPVMERRDIRGEGEDISVVSIHAPVMERHPGWRH